MDQANPQKQLNDTQKLLDDLGKLLFNIENYYLIYSELGLHYNKAVSNESSNIYIEVIKSHKGFFIPVQDALRAYFTIGLCSFSVKKEDKYKSIGKAIEMLKKIPGAPNLTTKYNSLLKKNKNIIDHIDKFRNQYYAHKTFSDMSKLPPGSDKEFQELFADLKTLLNEACTFFGSSTWFMANEARESVKDTHDLMNNLLRGESQRINEIDVDYVSNIFKDGRKKWMLS